MMLKRIFTITLIFLFNCCIAQRSSRIIDVFTEIKSIPIWYTKYYNLGDTKNYKNIDTTFGKIIKLESKAIQMLMGHLSDTTSTAINNTCDGGYLTKGQLAFILINEIEQVPLFAVTQLQWDVLGNCGILPNGFLSYIKSNAASFKEKYIAFFLSKRK